LISLRSVIVVSVFSDELLSHFRHGAGAYADAAPLKGANQRLLADMYIEPGVNKLLLILFGEFLHYLIQFVSAWRI